MSRRLHKGELFNDGRAYICSECMVSSISFELGVSNYVITPKDYGKNFEEVEEPDGYICEICEYTFEEEEEGVCCMDRIDEKRVLIDKILEIHKKGQKLYIMEKYVSLWRDGDTISRAEIRDGDLLDALRRALA